MYNEKNILGKKHDKFEVYYALKRSEGQLRGTQKMIEEERLYGYYYSIKCSSF